jgi:lipopolysaccharide/colanic/teichoic acid biosynthesis glycosyltransferase
MSSPGRQHRQSGWRKGVKMGLDRIAAACGLLLSLPLQLLLGIGILLNMGRPVFFVQARPGWKGRSFNLVKFRTMRRALDAEGRPLPDAQRLTWWGRALRSASLDELPQLWNVLRGDLSLVGPRPLLPQYLARYSPEQARRHDVLPGITGWAQVNGRNAISWEEKFSLDVWYVDHWSLGLDFKILFLTFARVLQRSGVSQEGHVTMPEFMGSPGARSDSEDVQPSGGREP